MDKRPNIKKRIALELFRSIKKNRAKLHELRTLFWECTLRCNVSCRHCGSDCHVSASDSFGSVRFVVMYPAVIAGAIAMSRPLSRICLSKTS